MEFMRKVSRNGRKVRRNSYTENSIEGYILKADIRHYFDTIDQKNDAPPHLETSRTAVLDGSQGLKNP